MITWNEFLPFALSSIGIWSVGTAGALLQPQRRSKLYIWATAIGLLIYIGFVAGLWITLGRPPLRTLGETRLWYALFMVVSGWGVYLKWCYRWIPLFSLIVATVFIIINLIHPELHDQSLMPALQSGWFIPHVTVYIFSYSLFGCAFLLAVAGWWRHTQEYLTSADTLVNVGMAFLSFGMVSGCIWAKQAWGNYWSWDPKETWAAATWCAYAIYIHLRLRHPSQQGKAPYLWLIIGFLLLQMCWYGVNFLPTAAISIHTYAQ